MPNVPLAQLADAPRSFQVLVLSVCISGFAARLLGFLLQLIATRRLSLDALGAFVLYYPMILLAYLCEGWGIGVYAAIILWFGGWALGVGNVVITFKRRNSRKRPRGFAVIAPGSPSREHRL